MTTNSNSTNRSNLVLINGSSTINRSNVNGSIKMTSSQSTESSSSDGISNNNQNQESSNVQSSTPGTTVVKKLAFSNSTPSVGNTPSTEASTPTVNSQNRDPNSTTFQSQQNFRSNRSFIRQTLVTCTKAKRVRFLRNGDQFYKGFWVRSFDALLEDLTRALDDLVNLPHGVRYIFSLDGSSKIMDLDELLDGESYVASSNEYYKRIDYTNVREPVWSYSAAKPPRPEDAAVLSLEFTPAPLIEPNEFVFPRIVTVIRNGVKPRKVVRLLLNKKTAPSLAQVLADITAAVKLDSGMVRKVFTLDGEQVNGLSDFFKESDVFIAYGTERMSIDDFYIDTEEHKFLFSTRMRPNSLTRGSSANSNGRILRRFNRDLDDRDHPSPLFRRRFLNHRNQKLKTGMKVHKSKGAPITSAEDSKTASSTDCSVMSPNDVCQPMADSTNHVHERRSRDRGHATVNNENDCDMHASTSHDRPELKHIDSMCSDIDYMPSTCNASASTSHPAFITDKYDIGRMVGDGNFAMVYACTSKSKGDPVAMKVIDKSKCEGKQDLIENEMALLKRLDHEHVVKLYDVWEMPDSYYFVMELVPEGDLFEALITVRCYDEPVAAQLSRDMCDALQYLHSLHIVHRDVKPENLLLYTSSDGRKKLKLADFGLAIEVNEPLMTVCGTPTYVAPEILAEVGYGCKVDIWAAGCITYIMLCGFPPFFSLQNNQEELFDLIVAGRFTFPSPYWDAISNAAKGLIQGMLQLDGDDRYSASEVLIHPWITTEACVSADYERMCRAQIESSFQHISQHDRLSETRSSHSFYDGDNVEFYYSRRRSMDDFSVLSASEDDEQMHDQPVKQSAVRFAANNNNNHS